MEKRRLSRKEERMLPLEGVKILDLTRLIPGPFASMILADFGAEVIKIEAPGVGDYAREFEPMLKRQSALFYMFNRNKKSVTLNLKDPQDKTTFLNMVKDADIIMEGFRPGVMERLGLGYEKIKEINPKIVWLSLTGFGEDSPYSRMPGHDINFTGAGGILSLTTAKGRPAILGTQLADLGSALWAVIAMLLALKKREKTGTGERIEVSMLDTVINWNHVAVAELLATGSPPKGEETMLTGKYPCYHIYETRDGYITVAGLEEKFWIDICKAIGREDLIPHQYSTEEWVKAELEKEFRKKETRYWERLALENNLCMMPVKNIKEVLEDEHTKTRGLIWEVEIPEEGKIPTLAPPVRFSEIKPQLKSPPPELGEHNEEFKK